MPKVRCIDNQYCEASLTEGKEYENIPNEKMEKLEMLEVIDETGAAYLFSAERFEKIEEEKSD